MALNVVAVEQFTKGRLDRDDPETDRQLDAALAAARTYCGWHVTPVLTAQTFTLDGPGGRTLVLPTLKLTALTSVTEDGIALTLTDLHWSSRGLIAKKDGGFWSSMFGAITVVGAHGYAAADDFESVVLAAIDRGAFSPDTGPRVIGPFQYSEPAPAGAAFTPMERLVLDRYALEATP